MSLRNFRTRLRNNQDRQTDTVGWTYRAPVSWGRNLECLSLCWHAPLWRDHPGYRTAEVGNPGGIYELPSIYVYTIQRNHHARVQNNQYCVYLSTSLDGHCLMVWPLVNDRWAKGYVTKSSWPSSSHYAGYAWSFWWKLRKYRSGETVFIPRIELITYRIHSNSANRQLVLVQNRKHYEKTDTNPLRHHLV